MTDILLWMDTIIKTDEAGSKSLMDFSLAARRWAIDHAGNMDGFSFGQVAPITNWWDGKAWPFVCYAKEGCRVWKLFTDNAGNLLDPGFTQSVAAGPVDRTMHAGDKMDVFEVWRPGGWPPDWFIVYRASSYWLVCLASETTQAP